MSDKYVRFIFHSVVPHIKNTEFLEAADFGGFISMQRIVSKLVEKNGFPHYRMKVISTDTLVKDGQDSGYYLVECSIANTTLTYKDGNTGSVVIGIQAEAKIVTQKKTIIRYLLEKNKSFLTIKSVGIIVTDNMQKIPLTNRILLVNCCNAYYMMLM